MKSELSSELRCGTISDLPDVDKIVRLAQEAAQRAGEVIMAHLGRAEVEFKGAVDLVTNADREAERTILEMVRQEYPDHGVVAEESGAQDGETPVRWVIDPIDGTTNFAHGVPHFAVSIGVEIEGEIAVGVVHNPASRETYLAVRGRGATLNGAPLKVSATPVLDRSLLVTGFPYTVREGTPPNMVHFEGFLKTAQGLRRSGSAALDLAYVARGAYDGYWELNVWPWDVAAGRLLVEEAGGKVTDLQGRPFELWTRTIVASNGRIHDEMLAVIARGAAGT